ncbi:MAG TPA: hypothetical protein VF420_06765 [Casimicrobiaceae bacterium]
MNIALATLLNPLLAFAQQAGPRQPQWDWPGHWHMWGGWGFWWIFPLLMFLMMIVCFFMFFGGHRHSHRWGSWEAKDRSRVSGDPTYSALQILNERYAKGEIQKQGKPRRRYRVGRLHAGDANQAVGR